MDSEYDHARLAGVYCDNTCQYTCSDMVVDDGECEHCWVPFYSLKFKLCVTCWIELHIKDECGMTEHKRKSGIGP